MGPQILGLDISIFKSGSSLQIMNVFLKFVCRILEILITSPSASSLCVYWIALLTISFGFLAVFSFQIRSFKSRTTVRKYFHALAVLIFIPGAYYDVLSFIRTITLN